MKAAARKSTVSLTHSLTAILGLAFLLAPGTAAAIDDPLSRALCIEAAAIGGSCLPATPPSNSAATQAGAVLQQQPPSTTTPYSLPYVDLRATGILTQTNPGPPNAAALLTLGKLPYQFTQTNPTTPLVGWVQIVVTGLPPVLASPATGWDGVNADGNPFKNVGFFAFDGSATPPPNLISIMPIYSLPQRKAIAQSLGWNGTGLAAPINQATTMQPQVDQLFANVRIQVRLYSSFAAYSQGCPNCTDEGSQSLYRCTVGNCDYSIPSPHPALTTCGFSGGCIAPPVAGR